MSRRPGFALLAALLFATASPALTVVEGVDFSDSSATPTAIGTLDLGVNTVSGTLDSTLLAGDDADNFRFVVDPGMLVTSVLVSISGYGQTGDPDGVARDLATNVSDFAIAGNGLSPELLLTPFGAGSFDFQVLDTTGGGLLNNLSLSYTVTMVAVPEPATAVLLAAALLGLGAARRSR